MTETNGHATEQIDEMLRSWGDLCMESWSAWTRATVNSDAFAAATTSALDWNLNTQKQTRELMGQYLEALEIPRRSDLARLSRQILAVEARVLDAEEHLAGISRSLSGLQESLDTVAGLAATVEKLTAAVNKLEKSSKNTTSSTKRRKTSS